VKRILAIGGMTVLATAGLAASQAPVNAAPETVEFETTGEAATFVVPAGVCALTVEAFGASGGAGAVEEPPPTTDATPSAQTGQQLSGADVGVAQVGPGGFGGRAFGTVEVTPGETLTVVVGGAGEDATALEGGAGGFNSGGDGADAVGPTNPVDVFAGGGGGGGATELPRGPTVLVAAGGGGGGGGTGTNVTGPGADVPGGAGGGPGTDGASAPSDELEGAGGGRSGGNGGAGGAAAGEAPAADGGAGAPGQGGAGGVGEFQGGGGGGGGYPGGGGGGGAGALSNIGGGGGGGGAGVGPATVTFETGVRSGDGLLRLSYDPAVASCVVLAPRFTG
jgi:hypothetical protein